MIELIAEKILNKAGEKAVDFVADAVRRKNEEILISKALKAKAKEKESYPVTFSLICIKNSIKSALQAHVQEIQQWCHHVKFDDLPERKSLLRSV